MNSRIILILETSFQNILNQEKGLEVNEYMIPTTDLQMSKFDRTKI